MMKFISFVKKSKHSTTEKPLRVSVIIPTFNEEGCIGRVLSELPRDCIDEVIIVDGGSTDNTRAEVIAFLQKNDQLILQKTNGYGAAFLEGIAVSRGEIIIFMDGDGSHNPADIPRLIQKIDDGYKCVFASRYAPGGGSEDDTPIRLIGNKFFTRLTKLIHKTTVSDSLYLFTAIKRDSLVQLNLSCARFDFCIEFVIKVTRLGITYTEIPVIERKRLNGVSKVNAFKDGWEILRMIVKKYE